MVYYVKANYNLLIFALELSTIAISPRFTYILLISNKKSVKWENKELSICIRVIGNWVAVQSNKLTKDIF